MIVIIHRGYLGFQPKSVTGVIAYSFTKPELTSFISKGVLTIPLNRSDFYHDNLDNTDIVFSTENEIIQFFGRFFQWDRRGPKDITIIKPFVKKQDDRSAIRAIPLATTYSTSAVLSEDTTDAGYLAALVHADATLQQIDNFCRQYLIGSNRPFVWTKMSEVLNLLEESKEQPVHIPAMEVREGPSRYVTEILLEVE